jgi:O-antigen/teichoic acid export membrane protein
MSQFKPTLQLMTGRMAGFCLTFFIPIVLVRVFDQTQFGTYKQIFLIYSTFFGVAQLGMAESLYYFIPSDPTHASRYIMNAVMALLAAGLGCLLILMLSARWISGWMNNPELAPYLLLLGIYLLLSMASAVLEIAMIANNRYSLAAISYTVSDALRAILFVVPALLSGQMQWLMIGAIAFAAFRLAGTGIYLYKSCGGFPRPDREFFTKQLSYVIPFELAIIVEIVYLNLHQYIVSYHFDAATFAIYSVGILQIPLVDFIGNPACNVMMVNMSQRIRDGKSAAVISLWQDTTRKLALIFFPLAALLMICAREIITFLFTEKYAASVPVFIVWSSAIILSIFQVDGVLRVYAATRALLIMNLVRLAVIALIISWFLSRFNMIGAVLATILALLIAKAIGLGVAKRRMYASLKSLLPWGNLGAILGASIASAGAAFAAKSILQPSPLPRLLLGGTVYLSCYLMLLFRLRILTQEERHGLLAMLPGSARAATDIGKADNPMGVQ